MKQLSNKESDEPYLQYKKYFPRYCGSVVDSCCTTPDVPQHSCSVCE